MDYIQNCIMLKNIPGRPYNSYAHDVTNVVTDMDHFPYTRFYRGIYNDTNPHIWEREAGFRQLENVKYIPNVKYIVSYPNIPTQIPCSTIIPPKINDCEKCNIYGCVNKSP